MSKHWNNSVCAFYLPSVSHASVQSSVLYSFSLSSVTKLSLTIISPFYTFIYLLLFICGQDFTLALADCEFTKPYRLLSAGILGMYICTWFSALYLTLSVVLLISTFVDSSVLPFKDNFLLASLFALSRTEACSRIWNFEHEARWVPCILEWLAILSLNYSFSFSYSLFHPWWERRKEVVVTRQSHIMLTLLKKLSQTFFLCPFCNWCVLCAGYTSER